ncbi:hypothetical protein CCACVL1_03488 [Corchorus capsularis]|uniref:Uncharacterized protein n=1 Tax=Corchorus capsularis TaxID=210143 RepID=A0A1R3JYW6_COCAP|nr:hypothetical protein CCACVL1_03488 [Corchorus capsularis]
MRSQNKNYKAYNKRGAIELAVMEGRKTEFGGQFSACAQS